jgi:hypothetical protein
VTQTIFLTAPATTPAWSVVSDLIPVTFSSPSTEERLVRDLLRAMRRTWALSALSTEAGAHGRSRVDVAALVRSGEVGDVLVGVEAKLTSWKRAFHQASLNRFAVDASFVAMPASAISPAILRRGVDLGVGVIAVGDGRASVVLAAPVNRPDPLLRDRVISQLRKVRGPVKSRFSDVYPEEGGGSVG